MTSGAAPPPTFQVRLWQLTSVRVCWWWGVEIKERGGFSPTC